MYFCCSYAKVVHWAARRLVAQWYDFHIWSAHTLIIEASISKTTHTKTEDERGNTKAKKRRRKRRHMQHATQKGFRSFPRHHNLPQMELNSNLPTFKLKPQEFSAIIKFPLTETIYLNYNSGQCKCKCKRQADSCQLQHINNWRQAAGNVERHPHCQWLELSMRELGLRCLVEGENTSRTLPNETALDLERSFNVPQNLIRFEQRLKDTKERPILDMLGYQSNAEMDTMQWRVLVIIRKSITTTREYIKHLYLMNLLDLWKHLPKKQMLYYAQFYAAREFRATRTEARKPGEACPAAARQYIWRVLTLFHLISVVVVVMPLQVRTSCIFRKNHRSLMGQRIMFLTFP